MYTDSDFKYYQGTSLVDAQRFSRKELAHKFRRVIFEGTKTEAFFNIHWLHRYYTCVDTENRKYGMHIVFESFYSITEGMIEQFYGLHRYRMHPISENKPRQLSSLIEIRTKYNIVYKPTLYQKIKKLFS